jgi:GntR family transcriptional regulator
MKSRYIDLAQQITEEIGSGKHAVGTSLPSEVELSEIYGVSRSTIRSALQMVQNLGLISRRKRAGIRIEASKPRHTYEQSLSNIEDLIQFATVTERHVKTISEVACDDQLAGRLNCPVRQRWMKVELLRIDPEHPELPICWTDLYIDPPVGGGIRRQLRKNTGLVCEMVEEKYGRVVAEVRQEIQAILLPERLATHLAAAPGSPALEITRRYVDQQGIAFQVTMSVYPAERFTYALKLRRQPGV